MEGTSNVQIIVLVCLLSLVDCLRPFSNNGHRSHLGSEWTHHGPRRVRRQIEETEGSTWSPSHLRHSHIHPVHYDIWLRPEIYSEKPEEHYFLGMVSLYFDVRHSTRQILLQYGGQRITGFKLTTIGINRRDLELIREPDPEPDQVLFSLERGHLRVGYSYVITLQYEALFFPISYALYLGEYQNYANVTRIVCASSLQPYYARAVFPCLDEPHFKATHRIQISRTTAMNSLSNMAKSHETRNHATDWVTDHFKTTFKMPSYLIAFVVFPSEDWVAVRPLEPNHMDIQMWVPRGRAEDVQMVTDTLPQIIDYLEEYFTMSIPSEKMDVFAVPEFDLGGMENPGLITVSFNIMDRNKYLNVQLMVHELVHQWLGNLASPSSWYDIWISEGLTTFLANFVMDDLYRMIDAPEDFTKVRRYLNVMYSDGDEFSIPVRPSHTEVHDAKHLFTYNYAFIYFKGAAVAELVQELIGVQTFREVLSRFLARYQFRSTAVANFLKVVEEVAGVTSHNLHSWFYDTGYPIVHAQHRGSAIHLDAYHFREAAAEQNITIQELVRWKSVLPVRYLLHYESGLNQTGMIVMRRGRPDRIVLNPAARLSWFLLNTRNMYYRVLYDTPNWRALQDQVAKDNKTFSMDSLSMLLGSGYAHAKYGWMRDEDVSEFYCTLQPEGCDEQ